MKRWLIVVVLLLFAACGAVDEPEGVFLPMGWRDIVEANRNIVFAEAHPHLDEIMAGFLTPGLDAETDADIARRIEEYRQSEALPLQFLSHEQIIYEIGFLFDVLRYGYAGYQYFGGDEVFLPLKASMMEQLAGMDDPLPLFDYLDNILLPPLQGVIRDNHFWINWHRLGVSSQFYLNEAYIFQEYEIGFVADIDDDRHRLVGVVDGDGRAIDAILPTLTAEGEFAWTFGYVIHGLTNHLVQCTTPNKTNKPG